MNGAEIQKSYFCKLKVSGHTIEANCPGAHNLTFSSEEMATLPLPASFTLDRITKPVSLQTRLELLNHRRSNITQMGEWRTDSSHIYFKTFRNFDSYELSKRALGKTLEVDSFHSPFKDSNRKSLPLLEKRIVGKVGDYRVSQKKGHKHAGSDLKGSWSEPVYAIANGVVLFVSHKRFNSTVLLKHQLKDGSVIFSRYTHLQNHNVMVGDIVNSETQLAELLNEKNFRNNGFKDNHLHLEVRKNYRIKAEPVPTA